MKQLQKVPGTVLNESSLSSYISLSFPRRLMSGAGRTVQVPLPFRWLMWEYLLSRADSPATQALLQRGTMTDSKEGAMQLG